MKRQFKQCVIVKWRRVIDLLLIMIPFKGKIKLLTCTECRLMDVFARIRPTAKLDYCCLLTV